MSQAKRSHVRAASKWREQVARELAMVVGLMREDTLEQLQCAPAVQAADMLEGRAVVDVHAAREHAAALIALEDEQRVFEDWTREMGAYCDSGAHTWRYARNISEFSELISLGWQHSFQGSYPETLCLPAKGWPHGYAKAWIARGGDSRAPMGRTRARLGRRILDALVGQPSECQGDRCVRGQATTSGHSGRPSPAQDALGLRARFHLDASGWVWRGPCPFCHGTGHNLRGVLPVVEWSAHVQRAAQDGWRSAQDRHSLAEWQAVVLDASGFEDDSPELRTRTVARGQHSREVRTCCRRFYRCARDA